MDRGGEGVLVVFDATVRVAARMKDGGGDAQEGTRVLHQGVRVPLEEEAAVRGVPLAVPLTEEASLLQQGQTVSSEASA